MKRLITLVLALVLCLSVLVACGNEPADTTSKLDLAKEYLFTMYKNSSEKVLRDFNRVNKLNINGQSFNVEWTVEITAGAADSVKVVAGEGNTVTIDVTENPEEEIRFNLVGTLEDGDKTEKVSFSHYVPAVEKAGGIEQVKEVKADTAYKFGLKQGKLEKDLYFTGEMSGNYLATTEDITKAVSIFAEEVEGGYRLYFTKDGAKTYIDIYEYKEGKAGIRLTAEPTAVFTWNTELNLFTANVIGSDYYLGTYKTFNTISASASTYITGDNASKIGVSQFPAYLFTVKLTNTTVKEPAADTAYKFMLTQGKLEKDLYFTGEMSGNYLATSEDVAAAVDVYLETVEGGYRLYFTKEDVKTYVDIYEYKEGKAGIRLTAEPTAVFTWNAELGILTANVIGSDYYLGTYNTFNTISASATTYITGDNASKIGISQFPAYLVTVGVN